MKRITALIVGLGLSLAGASASTGGGLRSEADINDGLLVLAVADKIRRDCNRIRARFFRADRYVNKLKSQALARGYSRAEIAAYIGDDAAEAKLRARRDAWLEARGTSVADPASLCALGVLEIVQGSPIGRLLKAK